MNLERILDLARREHLYPSIILYGRGLEERRAAAVAVARTLLCERPGPHRPCAEANPDEPCRHCRRLVWPGDGDGFHPDFRVLERDLRTSTSVEGTKNFLKGAYEAPFEARGQVFVIAEAETLSGGAADALLKLLEEPPTRSPRHFLLLAASHLDLQPTVRSRSLAIFLGNPDAIDGETVDGIAEAFSRCLEGWIASASPIYLLAAAEALTTARGFEDPRARRPWATAAAAVLADVRRRERPAHLRRALLAFAEELLDAPRMRVRGVTAARILEGLLSRHLAAP